MVTIPASASRMIPLRIMTLLCCLVFSSAKASWLSKAVEHNDGVVTPAVAPIARAFDRNKADVFSIINNVGQGISAAPVPARTNDLNFPDYARPGAAKSKTVPRDSAARHGKKKAPPGVAAEALPSGEERIDQRLRSYVAIAIAVITSFESDEKDKFVDVTNDEDNQGLSLGLFGWNIRQSSLQPLVKKAGKNIVLRTMPTYGSQFWAACNASVLEGLAIVRSWQDIVPADTAKQRQRRVKWKSENKAVVQELKRLMGSPEMRGIQMDVAFEKAALASTAAFAWAKDLRGSAAVPTIREFVAFFDTIVQNGSMAGLDVGEVKRWYVAHPTYQPSKLVSIWLSRAQADDFQYQDAKRNAILWASRFPQPYEKLLLLCWLRAQESYASDFHVQPNVLSRRGTILANEGWVKGEKQHFPQLAEP